MKRGITVASFPNMERDDQQELLTSLRLPEDMLSDIIGDEAPDTPEKLREIINNVD